MTATAATRHVAFSSRQTAECGSTTSYSLLALPPAISSLLSRADCDAAPLQIRGTTSDAAVLVTPTETYAIRGVQNSNSLCLASTSGARDWVSSSDNTEQHSDGKVNLDRHGNKVIEIESVLHETLELVKSVPKTDKLDLLLKGTDYTGQDGEMAPQRKKARLTFDQLQARLPASDAQIKLALAKKRVVTLNSYLRTIPNAFMLLLLPSLLKALPASALATIDQDEAVLEPCKTPIKPGVGAHKKGKGKVVAGAGIAGQPSQLVAIADEDELELALDAVDCSEEVAQQIIEWYKDDGRILNEERGKVAVRVHDMVKDLGFSTLETGGYIAQRLDNFMATWKDGSKPFEALCTLPLLAGHHVINPAYPPTITYLPPSRLSADPATRFSELFSVKPKWKDTEMVLFLNDLVNEGDTKKRDALVLKFVRKVKDPKNGSTLWTARNLW
ncbi:Ctf8p and Ctf18p associating protein [Microbotryomycetes sp. JL201]|nr:Ctf8p and Ctf18p associating protein [Microbotryomycetes sp. JL201]